MLASALVRGTPEHEQAIVGSDLEVVMRLNALPVEHCNGE